LDNGGPTVYRMYHVILYATIECQKYAVKYQIVYVFTLGLTVKGLLVIIFIY